jgi:hypothetical protein
MNVAALAEGNRDGLVRECLPDHSGRSAVPLLGDSNANHLRAGPSETLPGTDLLELTASGCKPRRPGDRPSDPCSALFGYYYRLLRRNVAYTWSSWLVAGHLQYGALLRLWAQAERFADPALVARHRLDVSGVDRDTAQLAAENGAR